MLALSALLALSLVPDAAALEDESLRARSSFGLFRDPYDYFAQSAWLVRQPGRHLYTVLAEPGEQGWLGGGYLGPVGFGVLATRVGGALSSQRVIDSQVAPKRESFTESYLEHRQLQASLGWGIPVNERLAVGVGLDAAFLRERYSLAADAESGVSLLGDTHESLEEGVQVALDGGSATLDMRRIGGSVGLALGSPEEGGVEIGVTLAQRSAVPTAEAGVADQDEESGEFTNSYAYEGYYPDAGLQVNHVIWLPGLRADGLVPVGERAGLRLMAEAQGGKGRPALYSATEAFLQDGAWLVREERIENPWLGVLDMNLLVALQLQREALALRVGLQGRADLTTWWLDRIVYEDEELQQNDSYQQLQADDRWSMSLPLVLESALTERWTLRCGARFTFLYDYWEDRDGSAEGDVIVEQSATSSYADLALGLRFQPHEAVTLETAFAGRGSACDPDAENLQLGEICQGQALQLDLSSVSISAVFHL